ncbi:MAG: hypothetical protein PHO57_06485 [Acidithiobacillus sp.]|nr:hypothetical protein [Acidithiobacillus sp.]
MTPVPGELDQAISHGGGMASAHDRGSFKTTFPVDDRRHTCLSVRYAGKGIKDAATTGTTRIYLAMPSCDGPAGCLSVDAAVLGGFAAKLSGTAKEFRLDDAVLGAGADLACRWRGTLCLLCNRDALWVY